ncbi:MAG: bile acid:sodium symporter [Bacteroidales bacterium]|nr:bile acid:sodium symporter [Candidatus Equibacterium intestinale]
MGKLLEFIKNWMLPLAMAAGVAVYLCYAHIPALAPIKAASDHIAKSAMPVLIFLQLLLSFSKVAPRDLRFTRWHLKALLFQTVSCLVITGITLLLCSSCLSVKVILEGIMVCLVCPTATAAVVITNKMKGNAANITLYTLISNFAAAILCPLLFPLLEPHAGFGFVAAFLRILKKVFPLLICPFLLATAFRIWLPEVQRWLERNSGAAFYLWAFALMLVTGQTARSLVNSPESITVKIIVAVCSLAVCLINFFVGKKMGGKEHDRITAGQGLGQKNTVLAIWVALTYLNPLCALAPGAYVIWQNIFNSIQLHRVRHGKSI